MASTRIFTLPVVLFAALTHAAAQPQPAPANPNHAPSFIDADAAQVLDKFRRALEDHNQGQLIKLFDPARMSDFAAFRDQVTQFFEKYQAFQVRYHLTQTASENEFGIVVADFALEATPNGSASPNVRKNVQLRLVLAWNDREWKIVDLAPLTLFS